MITRRFLMENPRTRGPLHGITGFSLVEMAVVLLILSILMSGVIVAISETTGNARRNTTLAQLRQIEDALYGFAQSQGRLPCPATAGSNGYEVCSPSASSGEGFVPNATLGLYGQVDNNGVMVDAWQNAFRYSVVNSGIPDFTNTASLAGFFATGSAVVGTSNMVKICRTSVGSGCAASDVITDVAPALVYSLGANWSTFTSDDEMENANGNKLFVSAPFNDEQFDDQLVWLSPYVLFNRMISAGKLP